MFLAPVIRQRLTEHLGRDNITGEINFFSYDQPGDAESKEFEKPYGYTWLLKLYGELKTWNDPDWQRAAAVRVALQKENVGENMLFLPNRKYADIVSDSAHTSVHS